MTAREMIELGVPTEVAKRLAAALKDLEDRVAALEAAAT